jgi:HSP20 family molecular chaperone IbpA
MSEMTLNNGDSAVATQSNLSRQAQSRLWFTPRFDLYEDDDRYVLMGDLPGVEPQDLDVTYENQEVTIHGKVKPRHTEGCFSAEYGVGDFHRSFSVGDVVEGSLINAELSNGVLTVLLPKRAEAKPRKINVKAG